MLADGVVQRRWLEMLIDPLTEVAIDKQLLAQQGSQIGQAPAEGGAQVEVLEKEQDDQGGPYLNLQDVGSGANEGLDVQILFERL